MDLERALRGSVRGEVRFDAGTRAIYAHDASAYRQVPIAVVTPRDAADVVATIRACRDQGAPILPRGGGTSLAGQCCNVAVVLDLSRHLSRVIEVDAERRLATVEAGCVLDHLRKAAAPAGLTFGPDPATHDRCTLGGMIGNNACGVRSLSWGRTSESIEELEIVTSDGERLRVGANFAVEATDAGDAESRARADLLARGLADLAARHATRIRSGFPALPRRVSGYNLDDLLPERGGHVARSLVGSEGTCATVLSARVRLVERPLATALVVLGYPTLADAADAVPALLAHRPHGLEGLDRNLVRDVGSGRKWRSNVPLPRGDAWLFVEMTGATQGEAIERARRAAQSASPLAWFACRDAEQARALWSLREAGVGTTSRLPSGALTWPGWEDSAVPPARLPAYLRVFQALLASHGLESAIYGHFGDGCVHSRISFELDSAAGVARYRRFLDDAARLVVAHGGSLSGEHGDGQARGALLATMFGAELVGAMREMRRLWDPHGLMNPGKKIDARPPESDLKAMGMRPLPPGDVALASLARVAADCVGVGKCRKLDAGTMCPSFMATRDEQHSTRGRARLLHEALRADGLPGGLDDPALLEALDLCLGCKACKTECPTGVDMTRVRSEVLARHHEHAPIPLGELAFAHVDVAARLGSRLPATMNIAARLPRISSLVKDVLGMAATRALPRFAPEPFDAWWARRGESAPEARPARARSILLWPDTFSRYFEPSILRAAVGVLEDLGFRVRVPLLPHCCGRALHGAGLLADTRQRAREILEAPRADIDEGTELVGVEPGCVSFFRDELKELLPDSSRARELSGRSLFFGELVAREAARLEYSLDGREFVLHAHCHEAALAGVADVVRALRACGATIRLLDSGCCGMAGPFGFRETSHEVSLAIGERVLLPAARALRENETLVTDGFSCREQVEQAGLPRPLHLAQVLDSARHGSVASNHSRVIS